MSWQSHAPWLRRLATVLWPVGLVTWVFVRFAPLGYNPTDDGYVISQARRILLGEVPHRDLVSPRPLGSALLHVLDFAVPLPLLEASRLVALVEFTGYSLLFAWLVYRRPPGTWGPAHVLGAAGSTMVNLHAFPLMSWQTTDGLTCLAAGMVLLEVGLERDRRGLLRVGLLCLGAAGLMKQSFLPALPLGLVRVGWGRRRMGWWPWVRAMIAAGVLLAAPLLAYGGFVAALGGVEAMRAQLSAPVPPFVRELLGVFKAEPTRSAVMRRLSMILGLLVAVRLLRWGARRAARRAAALGTLAQVAVRGWLSFVVVGIALNGRLLYDGGWAAELVWALVVVLLIEAIADRVLDGPGLVLLAAAWMTQLSWGYAFPNLIAGSVALCVLHRIWLGLDVSFTRPWLLRLPLEFGALALAALVISTFVDTRKLASYSDEPEPRLTFPLSTVAPAFGRIRTNPTTGRYLEELATCVRRYPARWVAVLPDNPGLYPALHLDNPFPLDWMYPLEVQGSERRIVEAARTLDERGDYLVLFQTVSAYELAWRKDIAMATPESAPFFRSPLGAEIRDHLHGQRVACGSFVGAYDPR